MRVENYNTEAVDKQRKKNKKSSVKRKDGSVITTTVTKENGVKTEVTEIRYPDGRIMTKTKTSGCGVHNIGAINLGPVNFKNIDIEDDSIFSVKDENAKPLIGDELKSTLDKKGKITVKDVVDSDGTVKPDYRIFDLNGDGRLAENEFDWFANGGAVSPDKSVTSLSADDFENAIKTLDTIRTDSQRDGVITAGERKALHSMLDAPEKFY